MLTCLCTHVECITFGVKGLSQVKDEVERLSSPQDKLLHRKLTAVVVAIVGFNLKVHLHED